MGSGIDVGAGHALVMLSRAKAQIGSISFCWRPCFFITAFLLGFAHYRKSITLGFFPSAYSTRDGDGDHIGSGCTGFALMPGVTMPVPIK